VTLEISIVQVPSLHINGGTQSVSVLQLNKSDISGWQIPLLHDVPDGQSIFAIPHPAFTVVEMNNTAINTYIMIPSEIDLF